MKNNRSNNSIKNVLTSFIYFIIVNIFAFVMRTLLVKSIGIEYAGLNSLLTNIIGVLNITEFGLSTAVGYSLYKPLFNKNYDEINNILALFKKLYRIIASVILVLGLIICAFIDSFVNTSINLIEVKICFVLYLSVSVISYLLTFLQILPTADQKNYIIVKIQNNGKIIKNFIQILIIIYIKNFYLWLISEVVSSVLIFSITNIRIKKEYPEYKSINNINTKKMFKKYRSIIKNTKNLMFHKIGGLMVYQTDNILISYFGSLTDVGIYANYMMIYTLLTGCIEQTFIGISASIGNLIVEKNNNKVFKIWREMYSIMMFVTFFCGYCFYKLANPFISVWLGPEYNLSLIVVFGITLNTMFRIIKNPIDKYKETYGIFDDIWAPISESAINFIISVILGIKYGVLGIVIGTVVSNTIFTIIWKPFIVFKRGFKIKYIEFIKINTKLLTIGLIGTVICNFIMKIINFTVSNQTYTLFELIVLFAVYGIVSFLVLLICFIFDKTFRDAFKKYYILFKRFFIKK